MKSKKVGKPVAKVIGANGNIFNIMGIASRTLKANGKQEEAIRMMAEVQQCASYQEAIAVIGEYVEFGEVGSQEQ